MIGTFTSVAIYIGIMILMNVGLAMRVSHLRHINGISRGHGGSVELEWSIRAHGNNAEYASFALGGMIFMALLDAPVLLAHIIGLSYTAGRIVSAYALGWRNGDNKLRKAGTSLTWFSLVVMAVAICVLGLELDN